MTTSIWSTDDLTYPASQNWKTKLEKRLPKDRFDWQAVPMGRYSMDLPRPFCSIFSKRYAELINYTSGDDRQLLLNSRTKLMAVMATGWPDTTWGIVDQHATFWTAVHNNLTQPKIGFGLWIERSPNDIQPFALNDDWDWQSSFMPKLRDKHIQNLIFSFLKANQGNRWAHVSAETSETSEDYRYTLFTYLDNTLHKFDYIRSADRMITRNKSPCEEQTLIDTILKREDGEMTALWSSFLLLEYATSPSLDTLTDVYQELVPLYNQLVLSDYQIMEK